MSATGAAAFTAVIKTGSPEPDAFGRWSDGQIDFKGIFSKLTQHDYDGWAVLEWECCLKSAEVGAREGSEFIRRHIIPVSTRAFDDFAAGSEAEK